MVKINGTLVSSENSGTKEIIIFKSFDFYVHIYIKFYQRMCSSNTKLAFKIENWPYIFEKT